ncbi:MAG: M24 family metallopeptidase [Calditrichia bacterium]|nr:M24 family metallopeptidase [Calditrichia bacterium]
MIRVIVVLVAVLFAITCTLKDSDQVNELIWKNYQPQILSQEEINEELTEKMDQVTEFLTQYKLDGLLLTQVRNVNWITAGLVNNQIVLNKDVGAASLLIMKDGKKYLICNDSEAPRMMDEVMKELGYTLKRYDWYDANPVKDVRGKIIKELAPKGKIGSDVPFPQTILVADKFEPLRYSLTDSEIKRYRWLGRQTTEAVEAVCRRLKPGMNEFEIEAMTAAEIRSRGIIPTVLLIGVDDRIFKYRHALPGGASLEKYAMVNVVTEKWGMPMAVTRFVHFGPLPEELKTKLEKTALVNAYFQRNTVPGTPCADIFEACKGWYAEVGYEGEWQKHHQGGSIGYDDREYVIYPGVKETVQNRQAFAWNPTITGAKIEDTIIVYDDHFEVVTRTDNWPMIDIELNGKIYPQPDILVVN